MYVCVRAKKYQCQIAITPLSERIYATGMFVWLATSLLPYLCRPKEKSSNWHFLDFHFFAKNYNLVNALSCVLVIFLDFFFKCLETRFFRFAKSSICICTYEIFHVSPRKKAVSSFPRKKAVSAEIVSQPLYNYNFIINQVLLFSTCI